MAWTGCVKGSRDYYHTNKEPGLSSHSHSYQHWEGHGSLPIIGSRRRHRWRSSPSSSWLVDLRIEPIEGIIIRDCSRVVTMISMPWKGWRALGGRSPDMTLMNCIVRRWLRQRLWYLTHIAVPEGLDSGIIGVSIIILNVWVPTTSALLVSGPQLRMICFNSDR